VTREGRHEHDVLALADRVRDRRVAQVVQANRRRQLAAQSAVSFAAASGSGEGPRR
jgi:hypothetical protein